MKKNYFSFSDYCIEKYGNKVYKLPINIRSICPNKEQGGCIFCGESGGSFENLSDDISVTNQLLMNAEYIGKRYKCDKFIAYFQNSTPTSIAISEFAKYLDEIFEIKAEIDIVGIYISTRPDSIGEDYLDLINEYKIKFRQQYGFDIDIEIELGLQSVDDFTLKKIGRGHDLSCFLDAHRRIKKRGFRVGVHLIGNLPYDDSKMLNRAARILSEIQVDSIKIHSLYILRNSELGRLYLDGKVKICSDEEYIDRLIDFLRNLSSDIVVQRLFGRAPESETLFCNWSSSWRKLENRLNDIMLREGYKQGDLYVRN